jgi:hypothetical protein
MNIKHYTYVDSALGQGCQMAYFQTQKSQFEYILEGLAMEEVDIFCCHVVYFTRSGIFCGLWVHFVAVLVHFMVILVYLSVLVCCNKKHLAARLLALVLRSFLVGANHFTQVRAKSFAIMLFLERSHQ